MKRKTALTSILCLVLAPFWVVNVAGQEPQEGGGGELTEEELQAMAEEHVNMIIEQWAEGPRGAAQDLIARHGSPDEYTGRRLIWHDRGDWWSRTEILNEEVPHNFPEEHQGFLYQTVDYGVPTEKASDLLDLWGSLIIDRVKGEITSRADREETNLLAINLAHQVVQDETTAEAARDVLAQARLEGQHPELWQRLLFDPETLAPDPGDPGTVYGARPEGEEPEPAVEEGAPSAAPGEEGEGPFGEEP
jgi:hypothetical protein